MTDVNRATEDRIIDLEIRLAHQEQMVDELSEVIARQDRTIDLLTAQLHRLLDRMRSVEAGSERSPQDDKPPPHW